MAAIMPFKGLRYSPNAGNLNDLVCPPYDIISDEERKEFIDNNKFNIVNLELPKGPDCYKSAGKTLKTWIDDNVLVQDEKNGIYVYEMDFPIGNIRKSVKGFVSLVKLEDFSKEIILPHEETLSKAKTDRFNLMSETFSNFSQIYSLYMDENEKVYPLVDDASKNKPDMQVMDKDGVIHKMWIVNDTSTINSIVSLFNDKKLYIADGHHRYETALNFHKYLCENKISDENSLSGYVMMMLVNMENDGLEVFPTHRIVRNLQDFNEEKIISNSKTLFDIKILSDRESAEQELKQLYNNNQHAFIMYSSDKKYTLMTLKDKSAVKKVLSDMSDAYCELDVSILHTLILEKNLGIDKANMAAQINLTYTRNTNDAYNSVDNGQADCCFILNPTRVSEIKNVAAAKEKMPQKSTYFFPKTITGLVMNKFK